MLTGPSWAPKFGALIGRACFNKNSSLYISREIFWMTFSTGKNESFIRQHFC